MSTNETPRNPKVLQGLAGNIHAGQTSQGAAVGLHHHVAAAMDAAIKKIAGDPAAAPGSAANKGSQLLYKECAKLAGKALADMVKLSNGAVKTWLQGYRRVLAGIHGAKANAGWEEAGFQNGKTSVPVNHDQRFVLLATARGYLDTHQNYQVSLPQESGPPLEITADEAEALHTALQTARTLINTRAGEEAECKNARDADIEALYQEASATIGELRDLLGDADPRWEVFGLSIPANPTPPEGIASLSISSAGPGKELLEWPYARRLEMTRVFIKREGVDADFVNVADAHDLEHLLRDMVPGSTYRAYVVAHNLAGDGPASPVVTRVVGA